MTDAQTPAGGFWATRAHAGLLALGDLGGPVPQSTALSAMTAETVAELVEQGLLEVSEPIFTLTRSGISKYHALSHLRNKAADQS